MKFTVVILIFMCLGLSFSQNRIDIKADFDVKTKTIQISQNVKYQNNSNDTLRVVYLKDWNNAYSTKNTPLAKHFTPLSPI